MKRFNLVLAALLGLILISGVTYGQRGGHRGPGKGQGRPDSTRNPGGGKDDPKNPRPNGPFGLSDSCYRVYLSLIPADQATILTNDLAALRTGDSIGRALRQELKAALKARDTAAIARLKQALRDNFNAMLGLGKEVGRIIEANKAILQQVRQDCMGFAKRDTLIKPHKDSLDDHGKKPDDSTHKGGGKDPGNGGKDSSSIRIKVSPIMPNPVRVGGSIKFTYGVDAVAGTQVQASITISDAMGNLVKTVSDGMVDIGAHDVSVDLAGVAPGVYILRIQIGTQVCSQKLIIR